MRNIPLSLKNKLLEKWQVEANDAQPNLRIAATQATSNTLISETIHENIPSDFGDVAIRQLQGEKTPSKVYALCIDNGIAKVSATVSMGDVWCLQYPRVIYLTNDGLVRGKEANPKLGIYNPLIFKEKGRMTADLGVSKPSLKKVAHYGAYGFWIADG